MECKFVANGLALNKLPFLINKDFLKENKLPVDTSMMVPYKQRAFYHHFNKSFRNSFAQKQLTGEEMESIKNNYLKSADFKLILMAWNAKHIESEEECCIVTEEWREANDNKLFKKIPAICGIVDVPVMSLPDLLKHFELKVEVK